ncbi:putative coatomer beta subunit [Nadsonia fulvescens var. elongata DSM 6958]|uniref:Coatomer subunit beta n=1 Tax=Nadsonia fulvescens var. elongata DSM 6958 TaxID=857566 RepID=A0A1E3PQ62_9ASCO|nr:putative coatomer beta subunit [Nadsonia fulvescens var. elongata DSM 6958]
MSDSTAYTIVYQPATADKLSVQDFKSLLEKGNDEVKIDTMKKILITMLNGDPMPQLLMHMIRFVLPSKSKELKKLLHFYWEVCPKLEADGKLKQEMILVCNAIRNDLQHPNEYIRGATLRFLCKLKESELLEPLVPSVRTCLEHRHAYVRKNAVFAVYSIHKLSEQLLPDAAELIEAFLANESDSTCKRNAFVSLSNIDRDMAFAYLQRNVANIVDIDELLQLAFIDFIRSDAITNPELKSGYLTLIFDLLEASSNTVVYEATTVLTSLTTSSTAVFAATKKFIEIAVKEPDNNVKIIVLERVKNLHEKNVGVLNDLCLEILLVLSSPDLEVRQKAIDIALDMVTSKNVDDVVKVLRKELAKTLNQSYDKNSEYRQLLIKAIHVCAIKFVEVASSVVDVLLDFISDFNSTAAQDVIRFVKEVIERFPNLRENVLNKLIATMETVKSSTVYRSSLWVIGEYSLSEHDIQNSWRHIRSSLGEVPILSSERKKLNNNSEDSKKDIEPQTHHSRPKILADGTYATEDAITSSKDSDEDIDRLRLRHFILSGNYFVATVLAATLTKLVLRYAELSKDQARTNALRAEAMLIMTSVLRVGKSETVETQIDEDSVDRIMSCIRTLAQPEKTPVQEAYLNDTKQAFKVLVRAKDRERAKINAAEKAKNADDVDDTLAFRQFAKLNKSHEIAATDEDIIDAVSADTFSASSANGLNRVIQLTGFTDSIYAEAVVHVHQYDVVLDVLLVNQTKETLKNLTIEFATLGDLKVVDKPVTQNIAAHAFQTVTSTIKVNSADAGVIFGYITCDGPVANDPRVVILSDIHVDIMDYIKPGKFSEDEFRSMWSELEWENKVNLSIKGMGSLQKFFKYLLKNTNMACLTPGSLKDDSDEDDCQFLSANLHAVSTFNEDALANLSVEKDSLGKITGHVRIRAKSQGLALSLGDKITQLQRDISRTA